MTSREWQPGDVAIVVQSGEERVALRGKYEWEDHDGDAWTDEEVTRYGQRAHLIPSSHHLFIQTDGRDATLWQEPDDHPDPKALLTEHQAGPVLWAHLKATLPTRDEPQDEPTDPGVRVESLGGEEWARVMGRWVNAEGEVHTWLSLVATCGPIEVIQPHAPSADERPFKVDDAVSWQTTDRGERSGTVLATGSGMIKVQDADGSRWFISKSRLTHADAPC